MKLGTAANIVLFNKNYLKQGILHNQFQLKRISLPWEYIFINCLKIARDLLIVNLVK